MRLVVAFLRKDHFALLIILLWIYLGILLRSFSSFAITQQFQQITEIYEYWPFLLRL